MKHTIKHSMNDASSWTLLMPKGPISNVFTVCTRTEHQTHARVPFLQWCVGETSQVKQHVEHYTSITKIRCNQITFKLGWSEEHKRLSSILGRLSCTPWCSPRGDGGVLSYVAIDGTSKPNIRTFLPHLNSDNIMYIMMRYNAMGNHEIREIKWPASFRPMRKSRLASWIS